MYHFQIQSLKTGLRISYMAGGLCLREIVSKRVIRLSGRSLSDVWRNLYTRQRDGALYLNRGLLMETVVSLLDVRHHKVLTVLLPLQQHPLPPAREVLDQAFPFSPPQTPFGCPTPPRLPSPRSLPRPSPSPGVRRPPRPPPYAPPPPAGSS